MSPFLSRGAVVVCVTVAVAISSFAATQHVRVRQVAAQPGLAGRHVTDFQILDGTSGIAFSDTSLYRTGDDGATWTDITPPADRSGLQIAAVHFISADIGWVMRTAPDHAVTEVWRTEDGGRQWVSAGDPLPAGQGALDLTFYDSSHGWALWKQPSSSNFSYGRLFRTTDGARSWTELPPPPAAGRTMFVSPETGWLQGGAGGADLFVTHDGGMHWRTRTLPVAIDGAAVVEMTLPQLSRAGTVAMQVALWDLEGRGTIHNVELPTSDGSGSPQITSSFVVDATEGIGTARLVAAKGDTPMVSGDIRADRASSAAELHASPDIIVEPTGTIDRTRVAGTRMWALVHNSGCAAPNSDCYHYTSLGTYREATQTFQDITPNPSRSHVPDARSFRVRSDAVLQSTSSGFDKCQAASVANMQAWKTSSPYSDANIYIGGVSRSCSQPALTSSWVAQVLAQNWRLIPTWVGPQSPTTQCSTCSNRFSTNATTARQQGVNEASLAANAMASLGLHAPSIVYYNLEIYNTHTSAETQFVDGWSERLHQLGYKAGLYVHSTNVASYTSLPNALDGAWIARWWYGANGSPAPPATTTPDANSIPGVASSVFPGARIWQYYGNASQTWGGATFAIDINKANGLVAVAGGSAQSTINVNATNNGSAWSGQLNFNLNGPSGISGAVVPYTRTGSGGTYSVQYIGGGPGGATLTGITPSSSQTVSTGGTITFTLNFTTPASCPDPYEPNNSSTQAHGPISAGASYQGRICDGSDIDWFGVDLTAGQTFNLSLAVPSGVDYDVELYGPNSAWATGSYSRGAGTDESIAYNPPSSGRYNIRIYGFQSAFRTDSSYTLSFTLANASQTLTVSKSGAGSGTVTSSPSGINCGSTCSASFSANTTVTLSASPADGSAFGGWSGSGCSGTGTCQVTMSQARSVTATFHVTTPGPQPLTVSRSGSGTGTVTSSPSGINCGATCSASFPYNTTVTLSASAAAGSTFEGWSGEGCGGTGSCQIVLSQSRNVIATFSAGSNPAPSISAVTPVEVTAGDPGFTLTVDGSGFIPSSVIHWNGSAKPTSLLSANRITALISAADIASPGTASVTVVNPAPGGGTSGAASVAIEQRSGQCPVTPIAACPATINRSLSASSCGGGKRGGSYFTEVFSFAAAAGTNVVIDLSAAFDTYLYLVDPTGAIAASNDDASGTNSQIAGTLQTGGTWTIEATSYLAGDTGAFTLSLSGCGAPVATPTGVVVTYNRALVDANTPGVDVRWNGVAGAVSYEADVNGFILDLESPATTTGIYGLAEPVCYAVRIRAIGAGGERSGWSARDLATSVVFSDDPLIPRVTTVKSIHDVELRNAVATVRAAAGLPAFSFSEIIAAGMPVRASHAIELRNALNAPLTSLGMAPVVFSDPVPGATTIGAGDLQRLRTAMK